MEYGIIIHGGAWDIPDELVNDHLKGMNEALKMAQEMFQKNLDSIDIVNNVIRYLEDNPTFDAGRGSFLNNIGEIEMDAIIASDDLNIGSIANAQNIKNPIDLARIVRDKTDHVLITGNGANILANEYGIETAKPEELLVGRELKRYYELKEISNYKSKSAFENRNGMGTVGCVCLDKKGKISVGLSTGGTPLKKAGRVGDTPIWGAGAFIEKGMGGAAATGYGEDLIKLVTCKHAVNYLEMGYTSSKSAKQTIMDLENKIGGLGGIIVLNKESIGLYFNTPRMAFGFYTDKIDTTTGIEKDDISNLI